MEANYHLLEPDRIRLVKALLTKFCSTAQQQSLLRKIKANDIDAITGNHVSQIAEELANICRTRIEDISYKTLANVLQGGSSTEKKLNGLIVAAGLGGEIVASRKTKVKPLSNAIVVEEQDETHQVRYLTGTYEIILPTVLASIRNATHEATLFGINFVSLLMNYEDVIFEKIKTSPDFLLRLIVLDPNCDRMDAIAEEIANKPKNLRKECADSLERFNESVCEALSPVERERIQIRLFDRNPLSRIYLIDPKQDHGEYFILPYSYGTRPTKMPGFQFSAQIVEQDNSIFESVQRNWDRALPYVFSDGQ